MVHVQPPPSLVTVADGQWVVRLYWALRWGHLIVQAVVALVFMSMPRSWFKGELVGDIVKSISGYWQKLAIDHSTLLMSNVSFANKFSVAFIVATAFFFAFAVLLGPVLFFKVAVARGALAPYFWSPLKIVGAPLLFVIGAWWVFLYPTPFDRFSLSEGSLVFTALFWGALQFFLANLIVLSGKAVFGHDTRRR